MSTASQTQRHQYNLFLTLSSNLTISVLKTNQVNNKEVPEIITIEFVKEEYRLVALHKLLRKAVIHLSYAEFFQLRSSTGSIHSSLNFIRNHVEHPIEATDETQQNKASETSTSRKPTILSCIEDSRLTEHNFNELKDINNIVEFVVFPHTYSNRKKQYRFTQKQSDDFNICIIHV